MARPAYPLMAMLRVHLMQNWFGYSEPAMEEVLYETKILRQFAGLGLERIPDETTILYFRRLQWCPGAATGRGPRDASGTAVHRKVDA